MIREAELGIIWWDKLEDFIGNSHFLQLERNVGHNVARAFKIFPHLVLSPRSLPCQKPIQSLITARFQTQIGYPKSRWLKFPGSIHSLAVSPILKKRTEDIQNLSELLHWKVRSFSIWCHGEHGSHRIPRGNGFSFLQLEMWPCNHWWPW